MKIIQNIAEQEESVIVGRCSDYILRDRKDCLNVFIYADAEDREKRIIERYGENDKPVRKRIADKDSRRRTYYSHYTDRSALGEKSCVSIVCRLFQESRNGDV